MIVDFMTYSRGRLFSLGVNEDGRAVAVDEPDAENPILRELVWRPGAGRIPSEETLVGPDEGEVFLRGCLETYTGAMFWAEERDGAVENAFRSHAQRRWFFAKLAADKGGKFGGGGSGSKALTAKEKAAVEDWSQTLYRASAAKNPNEQEKGQLRDLHSAMEKTPNYEGRLHRTLILDNLRDFQDGQLKKDGVFSATRPLATSKDSQTADDFATVAAGPKQTVVKLEFKAKTAADVSDLVSEEYRDQKEVLVRPGTNYVVREVRRAGKGPHGGPVVHVKLEESFHNETVEESYLKRIGQEPTENKFVSARQRKWFFANRGKTAGKVKAPHQTKVVQEIEKKYPPVNPNGADTWERHRDDSNGEWGEARKQLHDDIINEIRSEAPAVANPVYTMMGGGSASGKSTLLRSGVVEVPESVKWDADGIKQKLPEYQAMKEAGDLRAAAYTHGESSHLTDRGMQESFDGRQNTLLDGTGNNSLPKLKQRIDRARERGYPVRAVYATVSIEEAMRRNIKRAETPGPDFGRLPPEAIVRETHASVSRIVPEAVAQGLFDQFELWDTEHQTGGKPTKVASAVGTELTVHDQTLWDAFLAKGQTTTEK